MKHLTIILAIILLTACTRNEQNLSVETLDDSFPLAVNVKDSVIEFPVMFNIDQWGLAGDTLVILSNGRDSIVSLINTNDMSLINTYGRIGQGPDEFLAPSLINSENGQMLLGDGMSGKIRKVNNGYPGEVILNSGGSLPLNDAYLIGRSNLAYVAYSPNNTQLLIQDLLNNNQVNDSLGLPIMIEHHHNAKSMKSDFKVSSNGEFFVIAYQNSDRFDIVTQSGLKFQFPVAYIGNSAIGENKFFFIDVDCGTDFFAVLSMKDKDVFNEQSFPDIEIYTYSGNPIARMHINFPAYNVLIDETRKQLLLLSANDDCLHIIPFASNLQ